MGFVLGVLLGLLPALLIYMNVSLVLSITFRKDGIGSSVAMFFSSPGGWALIGLAFGIIIDPEGMFSTDFNSGVFVTVIGGAFIALFRNED